MPLVGSLHKPFYLHHAACIEQIAILESARCIRPRKVTETVKRPKVYLDCATIKQTEESSAK